MWWRLLLAAGAAAPLLVILPAAQSYVTPRWIAIYAIAGAFVLAGLWAVLVRHWRPRVGEAEAVVLMIAVWALVSIAWTPDVSHGLYIAPGFISLVLICLAVRQLPRVDFLWMTGAIVAPVICLLSLVLPEDAIGGLGNWNITTEVVMFSSPFAMTPILYTQNRWKRLVCLASTITAVGYLVWNESIAEIWAGLVFVIVILVATRNHLLIMLGSVATLAAALALPASVVTSGTYRLELGWNTVMGWLDAPLAGHGFGSFAYLYPLYGERHVGVISSTTIQNPDTLAGEAHNEFLQTVFETGAVGLLLVVALIVVAVRAARRHPAGEIETHQAAVMTIILAAGDALINAPLHWPGPAFMIVVVLGVVLRQARSRPVYVTKLAATATALVGVPFIGLLALQGIAVWKSHWSFNQARLTLDSHPPSSFMHAMNGWDAAPGNSQIRIQAWLSLMKWGDSVFPKIGLYWKSVDAVWEIAKSAEPHAPVLVMTRVAYLLSSGRYVANDAEVEVLLAELKRTSSLQPETWILEAEYARVRGWDMRAHRAIARARRTARAPQKQQLIDLIDSLIGAKQ